MPDQIVRAFRVLKLGLLATGMRTVDSSSRLVRRRTAIERNIAPSRIILTQSRR